MSSRFVLKCIIAHIVPGYMFALFIVVGTTLCYLVPIEGLGPVRSLVISIINLSCDRNHNDSFSCERTCLYFRYFFVGSVRLNITCVGGFVIIGNIFFYLTCKFWLFFSL